MYHISNKYTSSISPESYCDIESPPRIISSKDKFVPSQIYYSTSLRLKEKFPSNMMDRDTVGQGKI